tara:strand:- start:215 stop:448 length:234 start_codon:yes stop_codon:yes gene_type:complete
MNIDEWIGITTPKGEKINVNIFSDEEYSEIRIDFYDVKTFPEKKGYMQNGNQFDSIMINKADIRNELIKRYKDEHDE